VRPAGAVASRSTASNTRSAAQPALASRVICSSRGRIVRHGSVAPARRRALAAATTCDVASPSAWMARLAASMLPGAAQDASPASSRVSVGWSR
jgi:hypothetical protein